MTDIVMIAPYKRMADMARELANRYRTPISIVDGNLDQGVDAAREALDQGAQVVVSRGGTALLITRAQDVDVPVVNIPVISNELMVAVHQAVAISRDVGIVRFANTLPPDIPTLSSVFGARIVDMPILSEDEAPKCIAKAIDDGVGVIVGGVCGVTNARALGLPSVLIESSQDSLALALSEAVSLLSKTTSLQQRIALLRQAMDLVAEGVIVLDRQGRAVEFNKGAEQATGISRRSALGRTVQVPSGQSAQYPSRSDGDHVGRAISLGANASWHPVLSSGGETGAVVLFPEANDRRRGGADSGKNQADTGRGAKYTFADIAGESQQIKSAIQAARRYASSDFSVMLIGETGTGKELFAQSMHNASPRRRGPFVTVNCAALPESLLESELFGYSEGAFTGARKSGRIGLFEQADGGTVFLDEVSAMPISVQQRFLRVLEEHRVVRVGDNRIIPLDFRVIAATNRDIRSLVRERAFLPDLFYRLDVLRLVLPPLRERKSDIPVIGDYLMSIFSQSAQVSPRSFSEAALKLMYEYGWPGNVRELRNVIQRLMVCGGAPVISAAEAQAAIGLDYPPAHQHDGLPVSPATDDLRSYTRDHELDRILNVLEECGGNKTLAAEKLGISRVTLWRKLREHVSFVE